MGTFTFRQNNGERYELAPEFNDLNSAKAVVFDFVRTVEKDVYIFCGERAWEWIGVVNLPENQIILDFLFESFDLSEKVDRLTIMYLNDEDRLAKEIAVLLTSFASENNIFPNWHVIAKYLIDEYRIITGQV